MIIQGLAINGMTVSSSAATISTDTYFNLVTLLLPGTGTNGAQNNTFLDSSTNNFTVTRNGTPTQGTFSPFSQTGWSGYFDGTGDYLTTPQNAAFNLGTGAFTIESWFYPLAVDGSLPVCIVQLGEGAFSTTINVGWAMWVNSDRTVRLTRYASGVETSRTTSNTVSLNQWNHIAFCRDSSSNLSIYINGVRGYNAASATTSYDNVNSNPLYIGRNVVGGGPSTLFTNGYISNIRVVAGTAVYDPTQSTLTVPTTPLTAVSGTSLLTCQSNRFIDNSSNAFAITVAGDTAVQAFAPFNPTQTYSNTVVGGSEYMVRTDYLTVPSNAAIKTFTGDFTIESWVYPLTTSGAAGGGSGAFMDARTNGGTAAPWVFGYGGYVAGSGFIVAYFDGTDRISSLRMPVNQWSHVAMTRQGSTLRFFINGVVDPTTFSVGGTITGGDNPLFVTNTKDYSLNSTWGSEGYWADFRIVNGTAVYTSSFTPPTAPLTAITNTTLLLNFTNGGITDATSKNNLQTVGGAAISTAQSKFGGSSMYFDGSGDDLIIKYDPVFGFGTGDFTVEGWFYFIDVNTTQRGIVALGDGGNGSGPIYNSWSLIYRGTEGSNQITFSRFDGTSYEYTTTGVSLSNNTWYHIAVARSSGTLKIFVNGTSYYSATVNTSFAPLNTNPLRVALQYYGPESGYGGPRYWNGYIDDLRITKGYARYTANFTPPTQAFPTQ